MKSLLEKGGVIFVVVGLTIFGSMEVWGGQNWKYYGTNEDGSYYYDSKSMTQPSKNIVRVWVQSAYTDKGISYWVRGGGKEFQNLGYSLVLSELNCVDRVVRYLGILFYSKDGESLRPINGEEWEFFAPDSMSGVLCDAVCN